MARDVTDLHRQEEALRAAQVTLQERLVALATPTEAWRARSPRARRAISPFAATIGSCWPRSSSWNPFIATARCCRAWPSSCSPARTGPRRTRSCARPGCSCFRNPRDRFRLSGIARRAGTRRTLGRGTGVEKTLAPEECWASAVGKRAFRAFERSIRCRHAHEEHRGYACVPFHGQGQILGLFHIAVEIDPHTRRPARETEQRLQAMTDRVGPALSNLRLRDAMREMALRDGLTGLYNRRYLEDALNREIHRAERSGNPLAVIMIDIDNFKQFNDRHGHDARNFVLSALARRRRPQHPPLGSCVPRTGERNSPWYCPRPSVEIACERAEEIKLAIRKPTSRISARLWRRPPPRLASRFIPGMAECTAIVESGRSRAVSRQA